MRIFYPMWLKDGTPSLRVRGCLLPLLFAFSAHATAVDPSSPGNLRYSIYSNTAAEVFWVRATDDGLVVEYEVQINEEVMRLDALSHYWNSLNAGQTYRVQVSSVDNDGNLSTPASVTFMSGERAPSSPDTDGTPPSSATGPEAPTGLLASVYSSSVAEIFWDRAGTSGLSYQVSRNGINIRTTDGISHYDDQLEPATAYTL